MRFSSPKGVATPAGEDNANSYLLRVNIGKHKTTVIIWAV